MPLVYDELRKLAAARLHQEKPGQTLQATGLVHEAYLRLVGQDGAATFASRQHLSLSGDTAESDWNFARVWLKLEWGQGQPDCSK